MGLNKDHSEEIAKLRLMDDRFLKICFKDHPEVVEKVLNIIFDRNDIKVSKSFSQDHIANINGKDIILDIVAEELKALTEYYKWDKGGKEKMSEVFEKVKQEGREEGIQEGIQ